MEWRRRARPVPAIKYLDKDTGELIYELPSLAEIQDRVKALKDQGHRDVTPVQIIP